MEEKEPKTEKKNPVSKRWTLLCTSVPWIRDRLCKVTRKKTWFGKNEIIMAPPCFSSIATLNPAHRLCFLPHFSFLKKGKSRKCQACFYYSKIWVYAHDGVFGWWCLLLMVCLINRPSRPQAVRNQVRVKRHHSAVKCFSLDSNTILSLFRG